MPPTPRSWAPLHCSSFAELEESFATRVLGKGNLPAHAVGACLGVPSDMDLAFRAASSYSGVGWTRRAATGALDNSYNTVNLQNMVLLKLDWELN